MSAFLHAGEYKNILSVHVQERFEIQRCQNRLYNNKTTFQYHRVVILTASCLDLIQPAANAPNVSRTAQILSAVNKIQLSRYFGRQGHSGNI